MRCRRFETIVLVACILVASHSRRVLADAIVMTRAMRASTVAEIFVDPGEVRVEIEVGADGLRAFRNALPDELHAKLTGRSRPLEERVREFLENDWLIHADHEPLVGRITHISPRRRIERDEITGEPLPNQPKDAELVVFLELLYQLEFQPSTLTIRPPLDSDARLAAANIGFVVYHQGVVVNDFRYLSQEETLLLDWSDPWYSRFERKALRRQYDSPAAAFIYVEPFEVRKEIVVRPKDLRAWVDLGINDQKAIPANQREAILQIAANFLDEHTPVTIDDQSVDGTLDRVHFIKRTLRTSGVVESGVDIDLNSALIGAIFVYPIESLPQKVTMGWDLFNEKIRRVPTVASDEAGGLPSYMDRDDPTLVWKNFLTNPSKPAFLEVKPPPQPWRVPLPAVPLLCFIAVAVIWCRRFRADPSSRTRLTLPLVGTGTLVLVAVAVAPWTTWKIELPGSASRTIATEDARAVIYGLLHNVYRAFDYRDESTIYDVLDRSVAGDLLTQIYLETRQSLTLASQGGARVKVTNVELVDIQSNATPENAGFLADCTWNVAGAVGHWGHIHQRTNQYHAQFVVRPMDGQWKITEMELLGEVRL